MKSIQWKLVLTYFLLLLFALELFGVYMLSALEEFYIGEIKNSVYSQAETLAFLAQRYFEPNPDIYGLRQLIGEYSMLLDGDVFLLDPTGVVVAASPGQQGMMGSRMAHQEVMSALAGKSNESVRLDPETTQRFFYYAQPFGQEQQLGVIYIAVSLQLIDATLHQVRNILLTGAVLTLAVSAILGLKLTQTITRPLQQITRQAEAMREGDFNQRIELRTEDEIGRLAQTFNDLAAKLQHSWDELVREKDKFEAILANLSDGLIVFDHSGKVLHINSTACNWFAVDRREMLSRGTKDDFPKLETEGVYIVLDNQPGLVLRQRRLPFLQEGKKQGTIIVLNDVTEQQRLEQMRQEFVANVSHELRTPLTSIKSYVEALLQNQDESAEVKEKFLQVINSETDRMVRMVEDLLILSRTEQSKPRDHKLIAMAEVVADVLAAVAVQANSVGLQLKAKLPRSLPQVWGDRDQLHRLLLNIVNNAIKYTPSGGQVVISGLLRSSYLEIIISDTGIGIPQQALDRIFERFFRVDKARSRKDGGAGLGLAIAKQIAEAHGGNIHIASKEGCGTDVIITLPIAKG